MWKSAMPNALKKTVGLILLSIQNSERVRIELNTEWNYYSYIFKIKSIGILCISDFEYLMESESMIFWIQCTVLLYEMSS